MSRIRSLTAAAALALAPLTAQAHAVSERVGDFYAGMLHPVTAPEHLLALLALGLLAGQRGLARTQGVLLAFPLAMAVGAVTAVWLPNLPFITPLSLASVVLLGLLVVLARPMPDLLFYGVAVLTGLVHGYANGAAMVTETAALLYVPGLMLAAVLALGYGAFVTDWVLRRDWSWTPIAVRVAGSWIAAIGLMVLGLSGQTLA